MSSFRQSKRQRGRSQRVVHRVDFPFPLRPLTSPRANAPQDQKSQGEAHDGSAAGPGTVPSPQTVGRPQQLLDGDLERLEEQLLARAAARLQAQAPAESADKRRVEQLERRLRKLSGELDNRDRMLRELLSKAQEDPGVASMTEVTGLDEGDDQYEAKKEMMSSIFQANLALRKQVDSR